MKRIYIIISAIVAALLLALFVHTLLVGKLPIWNFKGWPKYTKSNTAIDTSIQPSLVFSTTQADGIPGRMYVFRDHQLLSYEPMMKKTEIISKYADNVKNVMVSPNLDTYAYISTNHDKDTLFFRQRGVVKDVAVYTADHSFTGEDETKNSGFRAPVRYSPDGRYLIVRQVFWEGCGDVLIKVATAEIITTLTCESVAWSSDGQTIALGSGWNYGGPISLAYGSPAEAKDLRQID
jgi:hypothetical protein